MEENVIDYYATRLLNPELNLNAIVSAGYSPENTVLKPAEEYLKTKKVQEIFSKDGKLDEQAFYNHYNAIAKEYEMLNNFGIENYILASYEKSMHQQHVPFGRIKHPHVSGTYRPNPQFTAIGVTGINEVSDPMLSTAEAAQRNKVWDPVNNKWLNYTPNDLGFWGVINTPLVLATNDDGTLKTDHAGNYYYELASNRENVGKIHLSAFDVITDDLGDWNWIDIFDGDNIEQSAFKTTVKGIATVAAFTIPGIRDVATYATAALSLSRALPSFSKSILSVFNENIEFDKLNTWDNTMQSLHAGRSQESRQRIFTYENVMDFATSSFMQLSQQRAIATLPQKFKAGSLKNAKNEMEGLRAAYMANATDEMRATFISNPKLLDDLIKNTSTYRKISNDLASLSKVSTAISRGYMVVTSAEGVYNMARSYGFDPQTSGFISLLTYGGLAYLFSTDYMRGYLYNTPDYAKMQEVKNITKRWIENNLNKLSKAKTAAPETKKKIFGELGTKFKKALDNHILQVESGRYSVSHGMIAEALEETAEEITQDLAFEIGKQWTSLKELYTGKEYDVNYSWTKTDPLKRYATAFVGGAIGGAVFRLSDRYIYDRKGFKEFTDALGDNDKLANELLLLVADNKTDLIFKAIDKIDKEMNVSKNTSAYNGMPTTNYKESQHSVIIEGFKKMISDFDSFLSSHNLKIEKERFKDLDVVRHLRADIIISNQLANSLYNDYFAELKAITKLYGEIQETSTKISTTSDEAIKEQHQLHLKELNNELEERKNVIRDILDMKDDSYLGSLVMRMNPNISNAFMPLLKDTIARKFFDARYEELSEPLRKSVDRHYAEITSKTTDLSYYKAWQLYKELSNDPTIKSLLMNYKTPHTGALNGYELTATGQFTRNKNMSKTPHYYFPIVKALLYSIPITEKQKNFLAARLLNITSLPDYIENEQYGEDDVFFALNNGDILRDVMQIASRDLRALAESYYTRAQNVTPETYKQLEEDFKKEGDVFKYIFNTSGSKEEFLATLDYLQEIVENVDDEQLDLYLGADDIQVENLDFIYNLVNRIGEKLGYKNLDVGKFISQQQEKAALLGKDYVLGDAENTLNNIKDLIELAQSLLSGAYDQYSAEQYSAPFGANNFLNSVAQTKGYGFNLMQLNKDSVEVFKMKLAHIGRDLTAIENLAKANQRAVISEEVRLSVQRDSQCILTLQDFILHIKGLEIFKDFNIPEDLETWEYEDISKLPQDALINLGKQTRNLIFKFEKEFYNWYNNQSNKADVINVVKDYCSRNNKITGDTSILQVDGKDLFNKTDLWHFLLGASFDHIDEIMHNYKIYVEESIKTSKCPFDSQEQLIASALKFLFRNRTDAELWFDAFFKDVDNPDLSTTPYIMKMMAAGGVGKSSTIIPAIYHVILHSSLKGKKCVFTANTNRQVEDLEENIRAVRITGTPDPEFKRHEDLFNDNTNWADYSNSIIFVDESTYIPQSKISGDNSISEIAKKYNIDFIFSGDTDQGGILGNIDQVVAYSAPMLLDSKRAFSDIMRYNLRFWSSFRSSTRTSRKFNNVDPKFTYWKTVGQTFEGNYFMKAGEELTPEYVEQFIAAHPLPDGGKILIFTDNTTKFDSLKGTMGNNIEILSSIEAIQGRQWNYVFTDKDFTLDVTEECKVLSEKKSVARCEEMFGKRRENWSQEEIKKWEKTHKDIYEQVYSDLYHQAYNELYTLFSRPINGIVSQNSLIFKNVPDLNKLVIINDSNCTQSSYPPVKTGLTNEAIEEFIKFKLDVLNSLPIQWEDKGGQQMPVIQPIGIIIPDGTTTVQCTPGYVWKHDKLEGDLNLDLIKNIIIDGLVKGKDFKTLLPEGLREGKVLIKYEETTVDDLYNFGNKYRNAKKVNGVHPWLVYSYVQDGVRKDIHLGMFHNWLGTELMNLQETPATKVLNEKSRGKKGKYYQFQNPESVLFTRPSNPLAIQNDEMGSSISLKYLGGELTAEDENGDPLYDFMNISTAFYNNLYAWNAIDGMSDLHKLLGVQKKLYKDIFDKIAKLYNLNTENNTAETVNEDVNDILSLVGFNRKTSKFRARGVPDIYHKFVSFVKLNSESNDMSESNLAKEYGAYIHAKNNQLIKVLEILNGTDPDADKKTQIKRLLNSVIYSDVSILVFDPEFITNEDEFINAMDNIHRTETVNGQQIASYNNALLDQLGIVLERIFALYKAYENTINPGSWENTPTLEQMRILEDSNEEYMSVKDVEKMMEYISPFIGDMLSTFKEEMENENLTISDMVNYFVSQVHAPEDKTNKVNENWVMLLSKDSYKAFFKEIFLSEDNTNRKFWINFLNKTNGLKYAIKKTRLSANSTNSQSPEENVDTNSYNYINFSGRVYPKLLKNNGFNFLDYEGQIYHVDGTLTLQSKVVQRHQIHLHLPDGSFDQLFKEVTDSTPAPVTGQTTTDQPGGNPQPVISEESEIGGISDTSQIINDITRITMDYWVNLSDELNEFTDVEFLNWIHSKLQEAKKDNRVRLNKDEYTGNIDEIDYVDDIILRINDFIEQNLC